MFLIMCFCCYCICATFLLGNTFTDFSCFSCRSLKTNLIHKYIKLPPFRCLVLSCCLKKPQYSLLWCVLTQVHLCFFCLDHCTSIHRSILRLTAPWMILVCRLNKFRIIKPGAFCLDCSYHCVNGYLVPKQGLHLSWFPASVCGIMLSFVFGSSAPLQIEKYRADLLR